METKHKDLLERLADMEKNWDEDGENLLFFLEILFFVKWHKYIHVR